MKNISNGKPYNFPATIEDDTVLPVITEVIKKAGFGKHEI